MKLKDCFGWDFMKVIEKHMNQVPLGSMMFIEKGVKKSLAAHYISSIPILDGYKQEEDQVNLWQYLQHDDRGAGSWSYSVIQDDEIVDNIKSALLKRCWEWCSSVNAIQEYEEKRKGIRIL